MTLRDRVAQNIQEVRRFRGLSQETLALTANVNRGYMGKLENSKHSATLDRLEQIALALDVDPVVLLLPRRTQSDEFESLLIAKKATIDLSRL